MKMRGWMVLAAIGTAASVAQGAVRGGEIGNGGDAYSQEFVEQALTIAELLDARSNHAPVEGVDPLQLKELIRSTKTRVVTLDRLELNGAEVDAKNYPQDSRIELNRLRWDELRPYPGRRKLLALHEYLGLMRVEENQYNVSLAIARYLKLEEPEAGSPSSAQKPGQPNGDGYYQWPNGGGYVHVSAKVDPSARIINSTVGPNVEVDAHATVVNSIVQNGCADKMIQIQHDAMLNGTSVQGDVLIEQRAIISNSSLTGECGHGGEVEGDSVVRNSRIGSQGWLVEDHAVVDNSSIEDGTEINDHVVIESSRISRVEIESGSVVKGSVVDQALVENDSVVMSSTLTGEHTGVSDHSVVVRSTLGDGAWVNARSVVVDQKISAKE